MNVLVTGGAGFIGAHLCRRLVEEGHRVLILDDLSTGSLRNLQPLLDHKNFVRVVHRDVCQPFRVSQLGMEPDRIYHLACPASPIAYQKQKRKTLMTAFLGTLQALEFAEESGARMLVTSTSEVYGDPEVSPQVENYVGHVNFIGPRACYDEGKRAAETLLADSIRDGNENLRVARIFNTYGPLMAADDGRVVSNFITQAIAGKPLTVYGDGAQTRSFCYVDDTVDGLMRLMESDVIVPVNIGNSNEVTMMDLAALVSGIVHEGGALCDSVLVENRPLPMDDPKRRCPDIARAKHHLGWYPKTDLETGLRRTVAYFRSTLTPGASHG